MGTSKKEVEPMEVDSKEKEEKEVKVEKDADTLTFEDVRDHVKSIERGEASKESRFVTRVLRSLITTRKRLNANVLQKLINTFFVAQSCAKQKEQLLKIVASTDVEQMAVDNKPTSSIAAPTAPLTAPRSPKPKRAAFLQAQVLLPEVEVYIHLLVLMYLIDQQRWQLADACVCQLMERIQTQNRRSLDVLSAKAYYYFMLVYERVGKMSQIRDFLHMRLRTATLKHDEDGQATLINCLLRSYLNDNLYELAGKLIAKVVFPEAANNNEWARFMFYNGCINAMQLDYVAAQKNLLQAMRKAPQHTAIGFKQAVQKLTITVELLLGEIPERSLFRQPIYRKCLQSYMQLTQAVRLGDVKKFNVVLDQFGEAFRRDKTYSLIVRLRQNVIKTAMKQISIAYSRISIEDIKNKLLLSSKDDAEYIVSKCARDGVVDALLNHTEGFMQSRETSDVYSTTEPQQQFDTRIRFCLEIHNQSVKAMRFPPKSYNKDLESAEERREREQQDLEFAKEMAEEDDDYP